MESPAAFEGCYEAPRAAALSGVPVSTVYDWARKEIVVPTVSVTKTKLWSYADLMALRIVSWLRHEKVDEEGVRGASPMREVRGALRELQRDGVQLWSEEQQDSPLRVDRSGHVFVVGRHGVRDIEGQGILEDVLDLLGPIDLGSTRGPDLRRPRALLRIVPGKCAGEPHLVGSRVTTPTVAALARRGYNLPAILHLYPDEDAGALEEAIELEEALAGTTRSAA